MAEITSYPTATPKNTDYLLGAQVGAPGDPAATPTKKFTVDSISSLVNKGYKDYVFSFYQSSPDDPVVTELNNDTGLTFTFTRDSAGIFYLVPSSNIDVNKVWVQATGGHVGNSTVLTIKGYTNNRYDIVNVDSSGNPVDDVDAGFIELRIYS